MDSPRLGFRRATVTSWALVGVGITGVAGASALAYADTVKPAVADAGADAAIPTPEELIPSQAENPPPAPEVVTTTEGPPPPPIPAPPAPPAAEYPPQTTVEQAPVATSTPVPEYMPQYRPEPTVEHAPAVTHQAPATQAQAPPATKRRNLTPATVMAPNYSPHVTISHGS
jgi:outer membrane biosynthesis protein TonB